jgi:septal ring factor EnvC (AmiA/AmiB activator)
MPKELQVAIERTGAQYISDFTGLYETINAALAEQYEARLAERARALTAKEETIATQREALATQAGRVAEQQATIAELRQLAETIQAEYERRREEGESQRQIASQAASAVPHATEVAEEAPSGGAGAAGAVVFDNSVRGLTQRIPCEEYPYIYPALERPGGLVSDA